jgi:hypothetical protein
MARQWKRVGDVALAELKDTATLSEAISFVLNYKKMRDECLCHSTCAGCPYFKPDKKEWEESLLELSACSRLSTDDVLDIAGAVFTRYQTV